MAKKGEKFACEECGVVVAVEDDCGCSACDLMCCGAPIITGRYTNNRRSFSSVSPVMAIHLRRKLPRMAVCISTFCVWLLTTNPGIPCL